MRFIKSSLLAAVAFGSVGFSAAFAQSDHANAPAAANAECVVVPGYKGRWYLQDGQWHRCRKSGAGLWVPPGAAVASTAAGGGMMVAGAAILAAGAAGIGIAGGNGNGPASP